VGRILILTASRVADFDEVSGAIGDGESLTPPDVDRYLATVAPLYRVAFRGPPWFERSRCAKGCPKGEYCESEPATWCETAGRESSPQEAHPVEKTLKDFRRLLEERNALVVIEYGARDQQEIAQFGAVFWVANAEELWKARYGDVPEMRGWLSQEFAGQTFLYRDEVFGSAARSGNLRYYGRLCEAVADAMGQTLLVGRTINGAVMNVLGRGFGQAVRVLAPANYRVRQNTGVPVRCCPYVRAIVPDDRFMIVVDLQKARRCAARP
jgi:hypothetical protein